jgi:hypothetical protein
MIINPTKSKAISFTKAQVTKPLNYSLCGIGIPEVSSCKYPGIILCSDLSWADQVNYLVKETWKALHFTMCILKNESCNTKNLAYTLLVHLSLEYGAACWNPYREGQVNVLDWVQNKAVKFVHQKNDSN